MTKEEAQELENKFKETLDRYIDKREKKDWDAIFYLVFNACSACCKKFAKGIRIPQLDEKILDSTILSLEKIKKGIEAHDIYVKCYDEWNDKSNITLSNYWEHIYIIEESYKCYKKNIPEKLSNFVYWYCFDILYDKGLQLNERAVELNTYIL